jgi:sugar phosphate isomerase/epimerase
MFRLASFTDEISQDLAKACSVCTEFNVTGAELRGIWETNVKDLTDDQVREVRAVIAGHGMTVCSIGSPFGKCELGSPAEVAAHMDILRRCADIANELDCDVVRGFAFWGHGRREKPWDAMLKAYEPVPAILEEKGVYLGLENEAACYVGTGAHIRKFLDMLGCPRVKAVWDPANQVHDPEGGTNVPACPDGYNEVRGDIIHVHMKDAAPGPNGKIRNAFMGTGLVDWEKQFQLLKEDGYDRFVSLETHVDPDDFPEDLRAQYGQYLTGEGREGASRVCLAWVRDAVNALA